MVYFLGSLLINGASTDRVIVINLWNIVFFFTACLGAGILIGLVWLKLKHRPSDDEVKIIAGSSIGICFLSGICAGGCIPAAVLGSLFSIFYIIPTALGIKLASLFKIKSHDNNISSPDIMKNKISNI